MPLILFLFLDTEEMLLTICIRGWGNSKTSNNVQELKNRSCQAAVWSAHKQVPKLAPGAQLLTHRHSQSITPGIEIIVTGNFSHTTISISPESRLLKNPSLLDPELRHFVQKRNPTSNFWLPFSYHCQTYIFCKIHLLKLPKFGAVCDVVWGMVISLSRSPPSPFYYSNYRSTFNLNKFAENKHKTFWYQLRNTIFIKKTFYNFFEIFCHLDIL